MVWGFARRQDSTAGVRAPGLAIFLMIKLHGTGQLVHPKIPNP